MSDIELIAADMAALRGRLEEARAERDSLRTRVEALEGALKEGLRYADCECDDNREPCVCGFDEWIERARAALAGGGANGN